MDAPVLLRGRGLSKVYGTSAALTDVDFTVRAGSMDATNGSKLARLFRMAGEKGIPLIGMNDSAGAYVPSRDENTTVLPVVLRTQIPIVALPDAMLLRI